MKKDKLTEIKSEDLVKLKQRLLKEKQELTDLYLKLKINKLKNTRQIFHKRKDISQILTIINQKNKEK